MPREAVIAGHSASKTRVNALMTRQSIYFERFFAKQMDARKPVHDRREKIYAVESAANGQERNHGYQAISGDPHR